MTNAVYHLTKVLSQHHFDLILNIGICGSYQNNLNIGDIVHIEEEIFSDLGATDAEGRFVDLKSMGFKFFDKDGVTYLNTIKNTNRFSEFSNYDISRIPSVKSTSVNTVNGDPSRIEAVRKQFDPMVENMEGGAVAYVCIQEGIPYFEFRAISNYVEPRNKGNWNVPLACTNIQKFAINLIQDLKFKI